jgi:hypothetical protein
MLFKGTPIPATYSWPGLPHDPEIEPLSHDLFSLASLLSLSPMPRLPCSPVPGPATRFQSHQRLSPPPLSASVPFSCSDKLDCITDLPHPMAPSSTHRGRGLSRPHRQPLRAHGQDTPHARGQVPSSPRVASPLPSPCRAAR